MTSSSPPGGEGRDRRRLFGIDLLHHPRYNKGTAFTEAERDALGLRGLLPPHVFSLEEQAARSLRNFKAKPSPLEQYIFLTALQDRNEVLFYRILVDHIAEMMPIIYTPTVGEACREFGHIFRRPRGLYVSATDRGRVRSLLRNWPEKKVSVIVVTDGERILGLGDLGALGMGIPIGKLSLYTACAGIAPSECLPVLIDVGTDTDALRNDPLYTGLVQRRVRGAAYRELLDEFVAAVEEVFPGALLQFEDFATENALELLDRYRHRLCTFNDDIQGTAAVTLAGLFSACRLTGAPFETQRILFYGAGAAATGIADLLTTALVRSGLSPAEARRRCWFFDSRGLVVASRSGLAPHKLRYAHEHPPADDLLSAVGTLRPTAMLGVSAQPQAFTQPVLAKLAESNPRPIVFALSNPTSKAECTAEQAYRWTGGRAIFASGSPSAAVEWEGIRFVPGQGNNAYIFPGLGLGLVVAGATRVSDGMFYAAAETLAGLVSEDSLRQGSVYPPLDSIRSVSANIAVAVARVAAAEGLATTILPDDLGRYVRSRMYEPTYQAFVPG